MYVMKLYGSYLLADILVPIIDFVLLFLYFLCSLKAQVRYLQFIKVSLSRPLQESKEFVHISFVHTPE